MGLSGDISLYIHIPFCVKKCFYCDFLSFSASSREKEKYIAALLNEFAAWEEILKKNTEGKLYFKSVFIGGGTPSCLGPGQLIKIGQAVKNYIDGNTEFTIEANPGTITDGHIQAFKKAGINRISIGLQSAQDNELRKLGRIHTYKEFCMGLQKIMSAGFDNINIDLMSGIPGQTPESYKDTLGKVAATGAGHISAYSLIVEPGTVFYDMRDRLDFADEDTDRQMYAMTKEILEKYGYKRYEISNYSRQGKECIHNIAYWTGQDYLGLGLGASSYIDGARFTATKDFNKYISIFGSRASGMEAEKQVGKNICGSYEKLTSASKMEEFMFLGLRMCKGVSKAVFMEKFGISMDSVYGSVINRYLKNNLLAEDTESGRVYLTDRGIDISNYILSDFILNGG